MKRVRKTTRPIRWNEICRAAMVMGLIEDYSKSSCMKVRRMVDARVASGKVIKTKNGKAQSSPSSFRARFVEKVA